MYDIHISNVHVCNTYIGCELDALWSTDMPTIIRYMHVIYTS